MLNTGTNFNNGNVNILAGSLDLTAGGPSVPLYSHVVFTAPTGGLYSLVAGFRGDQYGVNSDVNVLDNGNSLFSAAITSIGQTQSYTGIVALAAGQTIDFAFGADGAQSLGPFHTGFSAVITAVPEAGSILILGIGLLGGGMLLRHRRSSH
jgi:hypothetical protein